MVISNLAAEAQPQPAHRTESTPAKPERTGSFKKAEIVDLIRLKNKHETFGLLPKNQEFLAEVLVDQYTSMKKILSKAPPGDVPLGTKEFIQDFESNNPGLTPDKVGEAAEKYLADAQHIAAAIKIADWQAQILQVASGKWSCYKRTPTNSWVSSSCT